MQLHTYKKGAFGGYGDGAQWRTYLPQKVTHAKLSYDLKFGLGFDFMKGGKLPGLAGGSGERGPHSAVAGGQKATGTNGWSARYMWREDGTAENYVYHVDQPGIYGHRLKWKINGEEFKFIPDRWYHIETELSLNTPDKADGVIRTWVNGELVMEKNDFRFRTIPGLEIDSFLFSTFFGGGDSSWAPQKDEVIFYDNFLLID